MYDPNFSEFIILQIAFWHYFTKNAILLETVIMAG